MSLKVKSTFYFEDFTTNRKKLFEDAVVFSKHGKVLYILNKEFNELPQTSQDLNSLNKHYMKMISFLYVDSLDSLIESTSTLPNWQSVPSTIILENLDAFCDKNNLQCACGIVAFLFDTAQSCARHLGTPCQLFISGTNEVNSDLCRILEELYCEN